MYTRMLEALVEPIGLSIFFKNRVVTTQNLLIRLDTINTI